MKIKQGMKGLALGAVIALSLSACSSEPSAEDFVYDTLSMTDQQALCSMYGVDKQSILLILLPTYLKSEEASDYTEKELKDAILNYADQYC